MRTVPDLLSSAVHRAPDHLAIVAGARSLTFAQLDDRAQRLAHSLRTAGGLQPGDRFALLAKNELEYLEVQIAAMRAGLVLVPLNYRASESELRYIWSDCAPRLLIHGPGYAESAAAIADGAVWHLGKDGVGADYEEQLSAAAVEPRWGAGVSADALCSIMYTSGTTGRPKGAASTNRTFWARIITYVVEMAIGPDDVYVQPLPLFHVAAHICHAFLSRGATNVLMTDFEPAGLVRAIRQNQATVTFLVPTMIDRLCSEPTAAKLSGGSLRRLMYGAAPISPALQARVARTVDCELWQGFGMTEAGLLGALQPEHHRDAARPEVLKSAGYPAFGVQARMVRDDGTLAEALQIGELHVRGESLFDRYWERPEATAAALDDGWFRTGDIGYFDADGFLYLTARRSEVIITGGENVYPREVEAALLSSPRIAEAAVLGLSDKVWGQRVHAAVVPADEPAVTPDELKALLVEQLARYKIPKTWDIRATLPRTSTGKVAKVDLAREAQEQQWLPLRAEASSSASEEPTQSISDQAGMKGPRS